MKHPIYPCLWFNNQALEAAFWYTEVFGSGKVTETNPMVTMFELFGSRIMALNGGPAFSPNPSISFYIDCTSASEVEHYYNQLIEGGSALMALGSYPWSPKYGWLQDKYGINWQFFVGNTPIEATKLSPQLMFTQAQAGKAKHAVEFYTSLFPASSIHAMVHYEPGDGDAVENIKHASFTLGSTLFKAMDSSHAHQFTFSEGISLVVECDTQAEIDKYWKALSKNGEEQMCGWLKDQFGVSWQIVPAILGELMSNPKRSQRVANAFMQMKKMDIKKLMEA